MSLPAYNTNPGISPRFHPDPYLSVPRFRTKSEQAVYYPPLRCVTSLSTNDIKLGEQLNQNIAIDYYPIYLSSKTPLGINSWLRYDIDRILVIWLTSTKSSLVLWQKVNTNIKNTLLSLDLFRIQTYSFDNPNKESLNTKRTFINSKLWNSMKALFI